MQPLANDARQKMNQGSSEFFSSDLSVSQVLTRIGDQPCVLIQVIQTQGSAPREAGTWMVVTTDRFYNTIGGGHLEFEAISIARDMLKKDSAQVFEKSFTLGASLGQCCGGVMQLRFEKLNDQNAFLQTTRSLANEPLKTVALIGGGHVGHAIVQALLPLPFLIQWADSRDGIFPGIVHERLGMQQFDQITDVIDLLPNDCFLLVMSFTHAEDLDLIRTALARKRMRPESFPFIGLIGSKTKWARFRHRLMERGFSEPELCAVTCPIGLDGISGKSPAVIAASVAAQLLMLRS